MQLVAAMRIMAGITGGGGILTVGHVPIMQVGGSVTEARIGRGCSADVDRVLVAFETDLGIGHGRITIAGCGTKRGVICVARQRTGKDMQKG